MVLEVREGDVDQEPFDCFAKPDGIYQDPESCTQYYRCVAANTYHENCPAGTVFNPNNHYFCDLPKYVLPPCGTKGTRQT